MPHSFAKPIAQPLALVSVVDATLPPEFPTIRRSYREAIWLRDVPPDPTIGKLDEPNSLHALSDLEWIFLGSDDREIIADNITSIGGDELWHWVML
mmetsp:Transcript_36338/g.87678  ORF Transcript_36338/g.87678 Transcript_36338/m.87678 type:complete len:96 (+) Transcript_36338:1866-2153(+)